MVGFFSAIAFSSGNDEEKRELMSKKEVTERYDKNGDGELDYREKMTFLRELVESGEITEEQVLAELKPLLVYPTLPARSHWRTRGCFEGDRIGKRADHHSHDWLSERLCPAVHC